MPAPPRRRGLKSRREHMEAEDFLAPEHGTREWGDFWKRQYGAVRRSSLTFREKLLELRRLLRIRARKPPF